jgi:two-component system sensor histidine kinase TctE
LVLQPFYRALGTHVDGSGLGLPIVNEIVKQHHGEIQIEPMQAGASMPGTRISLRFRIQAA